MCEQGSFREIAQIKDKIEENSDNSHPHGHKSCPQFKKLNEVSKGQIWNPAMPNAHAFENHWIEGTLWSGGNIDIDVIYRRQRIVLS